MVDLRERYNDPSEAQRVAMQAREADMWTSLPCIVQSYDPVKLTCSAQPAISSRQKLPDGSEQEARLPVLVDVPVVFPKGGAWRMTFPLAVGDEVLVHFSSRCIDGWWQQGGVQPQLDRRQHDLSDGFAVPGVWSQASKPTGVSGSAVQVTDGTTTIQLGSGSITLTATNINLNGIVTVTGSALTHNTHNVGATHVHSDPQGGSTGVPT